MPDPVNLAPDLPVDGGGRSGAAAPPPGALPRLPPRVRAWSPWRARCLGCGGRGGAARDLCPACEAALPRIRHACIACGLPMPQPPRDAADAHAIAPRKLHCEACRQSPPPLTQVVAPFLYAAPLDRWLPRFKFHHDFAAGRLLSQLMLEACAHAPRPAALVPVPLHFARLRARGYDQARELARPIAIALALPLRTDLLARARATAAQSSLPALERRRNLRGAFEVPAIATASPLPPHIALVDDVMTTGATLHAAAQALLDAGARRVDAWACARAP